MYARIGDIGDIMMVTFLSVLGTTQTFSRNCALFGLCGKVGPPQSLASFEKQKLLLRGRLGAAPSPRPSAALTHQSFVKIYTRFLQRGKVKAQFPCLTISENSASRLMLRWMMIDEEYASGSVFSQIILTKFDNIIFRNSWHQTMMLKQIVGGDVQLFLKR